MLRVPPCLTKLRTTTAEAANILLCMCDTPVNRITLVIIPLFACSVWLV